MFSSLIRNLLRSWQDKRGAVCLRALFWTFWISLATFPIGYGAREVIPVIALIFLMGYYKYAWTDSTLARLPIRWIFILPMLMSVIGIVFSTDVWASLLHVGRGVNKGFVLPFIAMECVRTEKDLRWLVWASVIACFWQGLDGIWQSCTGYDFIFGYPKHSGRLTGSLGDYPIGNYIAMAMVPALGLWHILRSKISRLASSCICVVLLGPALFLLNGAGTRSGLLSLSVAVVLWLLLQSDKISCKSICSALVVCSLLFATFWAAQHSSDSMSSRLGMETVSKDGRWGYWQTAGEIIATYPVFGAGAGRFQDTFEHLRVAPKHDAVNATHPHNLYLDILYAHGFVGFGLGMAFLFGILAWSFPHIRRNMRMSRPAGSEKIFWSLALCFWLGFLSWLVNGIFGHDFYRMWYLALAMSYAGIILGAVVNGKHNSITHNGHGTLYSIGVDIWSQQTTLPTSKATIAK